MQVIQYKYDKIFKNNILLVFLIIIWSFMESFGSSSILLTFEQDRRKNPLLQNVQMRIGSANKMQILSLEICYV